MGLSTANNIGDISPELRQFADQYPFERWPILTFVAEAASSLQADARIIDVGAGDSPYRELFERVRYESHDWQYSFHPGARSADYVSPADAIPVADCSFDAVLCTQVLEHVPDPQAVIAECFRILRPGGRLYMTTPLLWEVHGEPFDFFRYSPAGLATLLAAAGFVAPDIRPRSDAFGTLIELMKNFSGSLGRYPDGRDPERERAGAIVRAITGSLEQFVGLDTRCGFTLGYTVAATKRGSEELAVATAPEQRLAARHSLGIEAARSFVTVCLARDILFSPGLLEAYAAHFTGAADATLVIYAPEVDVELASDALLQLTGRLGLNGADSPDMIALPLAGRLDEVALAACADAMLALTPPSEAFTGLTWMHHGTVADVARAAATPGVAPPSPQA